MILASLCGVDGKMCVVKGSLRWMESLKSPKKGLYNLVNKYRSAWEIVFYKAEHTHSYDDGLGTMVELYT